MLSRRSLTRIPTFLQITEIWSGVSSKSFATATRVSPAATRFTICRSRSCRSLVLSRKSLTRIPALVQITETYPGDNPMSFATATRVSPAATRFTICRSRSCWSLALSRGPAKRSPAVLQTWAISCGDNPISFATAARVSPAATRFTICRSRSCRSLVLSCGPAKRSPAVLQTWAMSAADIPMSFATAARVSPAATRFTISRLRKLRRSMDVSPASMQIWRICSRVSPKSLARSDRVSPAATRFIICRLRSSWSGASGPVSVWGIYIYTLLMS